MPACSRCRRTKEDEQFLRGERILKTCENCRAKQREARWKRQAQRDEEERSPPTVELHVDGVSADGTTASDGTAATAATNMGMRLESMLMIIDARRTIELAAVHIAELTTLLERERRGSTASLFLSRGMISHDGGDICCICHDDMLEREEVYDIPCHHAMHKHCLLLHAMSSSGREGIICPLCRAPISAPSEEMHPSAALSLHIIHSLIGSMGSMGHLVNLI